MLDSTFDFESRIPPTAYHPTSEKFSHPRHNDEINTVSEVEQLIRVAIELGGPARATELIDQATEYIHQHEKENIIDNIEFDPSPLENIEDPWLHNELNQIATEIEGLLEEQNEIWQRRVAWYENDIANDLRDRISRGKELLNEGFTFESSYYIIDSNEEYPEFDSLRNITEAEHDGSEIAKFGYTENLPLLSHKSTSSGRRYLMVPWCGVIVCTCGDKHGNPTTTLCKHEIAALIKKHNDNFEHPEIPKRCSRLFSPEAYRRFTQEIL